MENILPALKQQYDREVKMLPDDNEVPHGYINYSTVMSGYYLLADYFLGSESEEDFFVGIKNANLLASAVSRQFTSFGNTLKWRDSIAIGATLFFGLAKNHAFHDGNKRVALLILLLQLWRNGRVIDSKKVEFEKLTVRTAASKLGEYKQYAKYSRRDDPEVRFIADFVRRKSRKMDRRYYPLTYREFDTRLRKHGCSLENPNRGFIDVMATVEEGVLMGLKKRKTKKRVRQIGFPGWSRQIYPKAVKESLKATGLVAENGIDSQVFYNGGEPLSLLIDEFRGPLKRLRDR